MPVVSNTSPILNLAIIGRLSLLYEQFGEIVIPLSVQRELRTSEDLPGSKEVHDAMKKGWLRVKEVKDQHLVKVLQHELDKGEAESIALALQVKSKRILMDEREGRRIANSLDLKVTGVLGILIRAYREGRIPSIKRALEELRIKAGFHIAPELFSDVLRETGEKS